MKTLNLHLLCLLVSSIFSFTSVAQKPFEFRCTDYLATPDRSQAKFSYDKEKNTFTIRFTVSCVIPGHRICAPAARSPEMNEAIQRPIAASR